MSDFDPNSLRCFNPLTGKRDGGYCVWEGAGKCLNCQAADRITELECTFKAASSATGDMLSYEELATEYSKLLEDSKREGMSDCKELKLRLLEASMDDTKADGMLYREAADRIAKLEALLQKVLDDTEIGVVPRSHLDRIEAALQEGEKG